MTVITEDAISAWISKGEVIDRYFNPGLTFAEVDLILLNDDQPPRDALSRLVGGVPVQVLNAPPPVPHPGIVAGLAPWILRPWIGTLLDRMEERPPDVIRTFGGGLAGFVAARLKRRSGVPVLSSLHINPDADLRGRRSPASARLVGPIHRRVDAEALRSVDLVLPVYEPIVPYLERLGVDRYEVAYNMLNVAHLRPKEGYDLHHPVRVVSVGRQFAEKDPRPILDACLELDDVHLTLVGDGAYHADLQEMVRRRSAEARVTLHRRLANDDVCSLLRHSDLFAVHTEYWELSKAMLEAMLTGLPMVVNHRIGDPVPELQVGLSLEVAGTAEGYREGILRLIRDDALRRSLGERAREVSSQRWSPDIAERRHSDIYRRFLATGRGC